MQDARGVGNTAALLRACYTHPQLPRFLLSRISVEKCKSGERGDYQLCAARRTHGDPWGEVPLVGARHGGFNVELSSARGKLEPEDSRAGDFAWCYSREDEAAVGACEHHWSA